MNNIVQKLNEHRSSTPSKWREEAVYRAGNKRLIDKNYERRLGWQVIFNPNLQKWNYLIKPL